MGSGYRVKGSGFRAPLKARFRAPLRARLRPKRFFGFHFRVPLSVPLKGYVLYRSHGVLGLGRGFRLGVEGAWGLLWGPYSDKNRALRSLLLKL